MKSSSSANSSSVRPSSSGQATVTVGKDALGPPGPRTFGGGAGRDGAGGRSGDWDEADAGTVREGGGVGTVREGGGRVKGAGAWR